MTKAVLVLVVALGATISVSLAQGPGRPPDGPPGGFEGREDSRFGAGFRGPRSPLQDALDANRDGEISAEEIDNAAAALRKLDKNKDGKLVMRELMPQGMGPGGPGGPMDRRNQGGTRRNADARDREPMPPEHRPDMPPRGSRDDRPYRNRDGRSSGGMGGFSRDLSMFDKSPVAKDEAEKKILTVLAEMSRHRTPGGMNVPTRDGRILRVLAESIGAKNVVEIGTSTGYSTVWLCVALRQTGGKITTFEIDAERAATARENFAKAGVTSLVTLLEGDAHETVGQLKDPIDLLFLDADKEGYLDYVKKLLPLVRPGGLIVAHNMNERQADPKFVEAITGSPKLETVFLNLESSGIGVTLKKR